jgi:hypothetical protein
MGENTESSLYGNIGACQPLDNTAFSPYPVKVTAAVHALEEAMFEALWR